MNNIRRIVAAFDQAKPDARFGLVIGVWVALLLGAVNIRVFHNDNIPNVLIPVSLVREGNVELTEFTKVLESEPIGERYWAVHSDRGMYSKYPIWTGVMVAPLFAPLAWWDAQLTNDYFWLGYGRLVALVLSAVFAGALAIMFRRTMPGSWAVFMTFCVVFGSALWHHLGSHLTNQVVPNVCIALMLLMLSARSMSPARALVVGALAGLCVASRLPTVFIAGLPLGVFLTRKPWRQYIPYVTIGGVVFPLLTLAYNTFVFGGPLRTGYSFYQRDAFTGQMLEGAVGLLISPTCGLLFYSPFLLVGLWVGIACLLRRMESEVGGLGAWIFLGVVAQWLLFSKWWCWNGALTFGCRMLVEAVPALAVLIAMSWSTIGRKSFAKKFMLISGTFAILHHLLGTFTYNATSPFDPLKSNWSISEDFIALYIQQAGAVELLIEFVRQVSLFALVLVIAGYLASRFFLPEERSELAIESQEVAGHVSIPPKSSI